MNNSVRKVSSSALILEDENVLSDDDIYVETDADVSIRQDYLTNETYGYTQPGSKRDGDAPQMNSEAKLSYLQPVITRQTPVIV